MAKIILLLFTLTFLLSADVINFDDPAFNHLKSINSVDPNYQGFTWNNDWCILDVTKYNPNSGYFNARTSGNNIAFNAWANNTLMSGELFNFEGANFTAAWNTGLNIDITGKKDGIELYSQTLIVDCFAPTWYDLNFNGIDELQFHSYGGKKYAPYIGGGEHFAMDDLTFNRDSVPEPSTMALFSLALIPLALSRRKKK